MAHQDKGLEIAADVLKQLITLCSAIVAATLALFLANKSEPASHWLPITIAGVGGLCIITSLLFLTDLSASGLGSSSHSTRFRYWLFIFCWALFFLSAFGAAAYVLLLPGVA
jgi:hypothetical protein